MKSIQPQTPDESGWLFLLYNFFAIIHYVPFFDGLKEAHLCKPNTMHNKTFAENAYYQGKNRKWYQGPIACCTYLGECNIN